MMVGERLEVSECILVDFAAIFTNAAQQSLSRGAEGPVNPAGVPFARVSLFALENPLQWIIHDPPIGVELRYEPI
jgi:hypothetical protein